MLGLGDVKMNKTGSRREADAETKGTGAQGNDSFWEIVFILVLHWEGSSRKYVQSGAALKTFITSCKIQYIDLHSRPCTLFPLRQLHIAFLFCFILEDWLIVS